MEGDLANAIAWAPGERKPPCDLLSIVRDISSLSKAKVISFQWVRRAANGVADFLSKVGWIVF